MIDAPIDSLVDPFDRPRRRAAALFLAALGAAFVLVPGCRCGAPVETPVVFRVTNDTTGPLFVDDTAGRLGVELQRASGLGGAFATFDEAPCPCRLCDRVCEGGCECPDAGAFVRRLEAGAWIDRTWGGSIGVPEVRQCDGRLTDCTAPQQALTNETLRARWCFTTQAPGLVVSDAGRAEGELPLLGRECVEQDFRPADGVVQLRPRRGTDCADAGPCAGKDELCLAGSCTAGCPSNAVPLAGAEWTLVVASPDDRGFFEHAPRDGGTQATGEGVLSAVSFQGGTLQLQLRSTLTGREGSTGAVSVRLPLATGLPLRVGDPVSVLLVESASNAQGGNRALVLRDPTSRAVLFAADMGQGGPLLTASDVAPFRVGEGAAPFACRFDLCGRLFFFPTLFEVGGAVTSVEPGGSVEAAGPSGGYRLLSVLQGRYAALGSRCSVGSFSTWALWRTSPPG